jgi:integration host factor subunit beta
MLKSDLIAILVQKRGITQKQAESTVESIFECMKDALCKGENIEIRGLGAFHVKHYDGYQGRNPKTGQVIPVKPKRGILFRTGKELRDRVNRAMLAQMPSASAVEQQQANMIEATQSVPAPVTPSASGAEPEHEKPAGGPSSEPGAETEGTGNAQSA